MELQANIKLEESNQETHYTGVMQCFCLNEKKEDPEFTLEKTFTISLYFILQHDYYFPEGALEI